MLVRCLAWRAVKVSLSIGRNHNGVAQVGKVFESWDRALSLMHVSRHLALKPQLRTGKNRGAQRVRLNLRLLEWGDVCVAVCSSSVPSPKCNVCIETYRQLLR